MPGFQDGHSPIEQASSHRFGNEPGCAPETKDVMRPTPALALSCLLATALLGPARAAGPEIAHYTLTNGLELVVIPDHRAPVVTHMIWYRVGAADEQPGKSGLAHFLEHLMFKGTEKHPSGEFARQGPPLRGPQDPYPPQASTGFL